MTLVVIDESLQAYNFGPQHPLAPRRVMLTFECIRDHGLLQASHVRTSLISANVSDEDLQAIHSPTYIDAVKRASSDPDFFDSAFGIGTLDVPRFEAMHEASRRVCAATLTAAQAVARGEVAHAVNLAGGLHHAMPDKASGFCVYNDIALSIQWLLDNGFQRIAYIDVDAHHGDGVERIFWNDPRVLTMSIHESGRTLFPGTGDVGDIGGEKAKGFAVNIPLPKHVSDNDWLRAFTAVVPELVAQFNPDIIVSQHGCDSHREDPLTHMELSIDAQRASYEIIHDLAHVHANGKWLAVGGGGYAIETVVPRIWTHLVAIATHQPELVKFSDGETPQWKDLSSGWDPHNEIDRIVMATRRAVFPLHGLPVHPTSGF